MSFMPNAYRAIVMLFLATVVLSCSRSPTYTRDLKVKQVAEYQADVCLHIDCAKWRELRLIYTTSGLSNEAYKMVMKDTGKYFDKYDERLVLKVLRQEEKQQSVNGKENTPIYVSYPPGKIELVIDGKKVGEFLPNQADEGTPKLSR